MKYGIPVKHVLLDNQSLGKISKEQLAADFPTAPPCCTSGKIPNSCDTMPALGVTAARIATGGKGR